MLKHIEWVERCGIRFIEATGMCPEKALGFATECFKNNDPLLGISPEQAADNVIAKANKILTPLQFK